MSFENPLLHLKGFLWPWSMEKGGNSIPKGSLSELRELVVDREAWRAAIQGSQRVGHDWATELNWILIHKTLD